MITIASQYSVPAATSDIGATGTNFCPLTHHMRVHGSDSGDD